MKLSKKIIAGVTTLLIIMSLGTFSANAEVHKEKITLGKNVATLNLTATSIAATARTTSNKSAESLQTFVVTTKVDKNGKQITPDMDSNYCKPGTDSGKAGVGIKVGSGHRYKKVASTHGIKYKGYKEQAINLSESF